MALSGWQIESAANARRQMEQAAQRRQELLNPPAPELPQEAIGAMGGLARSYRRSYGQARQANEARYNQMLRIASGERRRQAGVQQQMLGTLDVGEGQRAADIRGAGAREEATIMQQLARQGLGGGAMGAPLRKGARRETQAELNRLAVTMGRERRDVLRQIAAPREGERLGIMERRTDAYPDPSALTGAFGAIGGGYGGAGLTSMLKSLTRMQR